MTVFFLYYFHFLCGLVSVVHSFLVFFVKMSRFILKFLILFSRNQHHLALFFYWNLPLIGLSSNNRSKVLPQLIHLLSHKIFIQKKHTPQILIFTLSVSLMLECINLLRYFLSFDQSRQNFTRQIIKYPPFYNLTFWHGELTPDSELFGFVEI